jgi:protein-S-isoprenylcysteine O-methyltransferase Ste14
MLFQILLATLLFACLSSFTWAMRNFFVKPERMTTGLRITLLAGVLFAILHFVIILGSTNLKPAAVLAGIVLYCLSLGMFWWTVAANRVKPLAACFSKHEQLHLVKNGPYRFVRHPFYCSYLLAWLAGAVATLNIWLALSFLAMFVLYLTAALNEEKKFSTSSLAGAYADYCGATGRFLPSPLKLMTHKRSR